MSTRLPPQDGGARASRRLRIEVPAAPAPGLLRAAIAARLAGRAFPGAAEDAVGRAVADAVRAGGAPPAGSPRDPGARP